MGLIKIYKILGIRQDSQPVSAIVPAFMVLSAIGLLLSIATHVATLAGAPVPGGKLVWWLHIGVFVVFIPAAVIANRINRGRPQNDFWKKVLSGCPAWMRYLLYALFAYAIANFLWVMATGGFQKPPEDAPLSGLRGFSGHWMVFYAAAFGIFYSAYRNSRPKCLDGHVVSTTDTLCPTCGSKVQESQIRE